VAAKQWSVYLTTIIVRILGAAISTIAPILMLFPSDECSRSYAIDVLACATRTTCGKQSQGMRSILGEVAGDRTGAFLQMYAEHLQLYAESHHRHWLHQLQLRHPCVDTPGGGKAVNLQTHRDHDRCIQKICNKVDCNGDNYAPTTEHITIDVDDSGNTHQGGT
jgi:hypothetical protein